MRTITERRIIAANGNELAERLLAITGHRVEITIDIWSEDDPEDRDYCDLTFPDMEEACWFSILGDNSMGSLVDIKNNEDGHLIVTGDFGDYGRDEFNVHTSEHLHMQKIVDV